VAADLPRIGVLYTATPSPQSREGLRDALEELGYIDGKSALIEWRWPQRGAEVLDVLADELVRARLQVIVAFGNAASRSAMRATGQIPVVFMSGDPVGAGLAHSLARPGKNGTGLYVPTPELEAKRLEILKQLSPRAKRIAYLWNSNNPLADRTRAEAEKAATALDLRLNVVDVRTDAELDAILAKLTPTMTDGVLVGSDPVVATATPRIAQAMRRARLPCIYPWSDAHRSGGLISYGISAKAMTRVAAGYVDRILRGANPAELPIEEYSKFELLINLQAAREIGIDVPASLRVRADKVIE
jgi:putative ABC transport system substrate-binding protein